VRGHGAQGLALVLFDGVARVEALELSVGIHSDQNIGHVGLQKVQILDLEKAVFLSLLT